MSHRETLIAKLKADVAAGRAVTIVGSGASVATSGNQTIDGFQVATWVGLLKHGVQHCAAIGVADVRVSALLNMQIDSGELDFLISAAETISQRMKARSEGVFFAAG